MAAGGGRREPPHTLQGLLELAVTAGGAQPGPREPMGEERQQWLRAALTEALTGAGAAGAGAGALTGGSGALTGAGALTGGSGALTRAGALTGAGAGAGALTGGSGALTGAGAVSGAVSGGSEVPLALTGAVSGGSEGPGALTTAMSGGSGAVSGAVSGVSGALTMSGGSGAVSGGSGAVSGALTGALTVSGGSGAVSGALTGALTVSGAAAELRRCLDVLARPCPGEAAAERGPGDTSEHERALGELGELCESLDIANDFCSLGGLEAALALLGHPWAPLRAGAARVLGSCAQNLPGAQARALALGALPALLGGLRGDPDPRVPPAALFAISCLVRAQPEGLQQLEALGGLEALGATLESPQPPLRARGAFLLHCLLREHPRLKAPLLQLGLVPRAAALLRSEHDGAHEHGLGTLCALATECPEGLRECRDPALGLEPLLRERRELLRGRDEFQEELEFCERLLQLCFETPPEEATMDR